MMRHLGKEFLLLIVLPIFLMSCSAEYEKAYQFSYDFDKDQQEWAAGFADLPADHDVTAESTGFDTVLYARATCDDTATELDCNDDATPPFLLPDQNQCEWSHEDSQESIWTSR